MQFNQGASVLAVDGKTAGHIERVVIDPQTNEITHLVLRRGLLHKADKVVPINAITIGQGGQLIAHLTSDDLELLPDYAEERYVLLDKSEGSDTSSAVVMYPPYPGGVPAIAHYGPEYISETHLNIPDHTVALKEGAKVLSRDEKEVGHITQVLTSTRADQVSHFLITKGFLVKETRLIPVSWVDRLADDEVRLAIDAVTVDRLPIIEPA